MRVNPGQTISAQWTGIGLHHVSGTDHAVTIPLPQRPPLPHRIRRRPSHVADSRSDAALERRLGPFDAAAIIVSNVIGGGILFTPPRSRPRATAWMFLGVWLGGLLAFAGAMAYAELAALRPRAGGEYVYLRAAFGRLAAFLTGWTSFVAGFSGAIAASAFVLASTSDGSCRRPTTPRRSSRSRCLDVPLIFCRQALVALAAIALMSWIHLRGVGPGRLVGNVLAALKVSAFLLFIALGLSLRRRLCLEPPQSGGAVGAAWLLALIPVMFTYSGWNAAAYVAEEIRDPGRNVPRARSLSLSDARVLSIPSRKRSIASR